MITNEPQQLCLSSGAWWKFPAGTQISHPEVNSDNRGDASRHGPATGFGSRSGHRSPSPCPACLGDIWVLSINKDKKPWFLKAAFLKNEGTPLQEPEQSSRGLCWLEKGLGWLWLVVITG